MVNNIALILRSGVYQWVILRISAVIIFSYTIYLSQFIISIDELTYEEWRSFFANGFNKTYISLVIFSIFLHGWIGMSHIVSDYIKQIILKKIVQLFIIKILLIYFFYGLIFVWRI